MASTITSLWNQFRRETLLSFMRKCFFRVLSVGPIPQHIAFILDGNRRFARGHNLTEGAGHRVGFLALMAMLKYCYEMGVKYVSIYAFSIDNFRRKPHEVEYVMNLMLDKIQGFLKEETIVNSYGIRVHFVGNLQLLPVSVRVAAEKAMAATAKNDKVFLMVCVAYTSTDEIVHAVEEACKEKKLEIQAMKKNGKNGIQLEEIEKHMYMSMAPETDILVRTSGETRLSNYLLWQTQFCDLYSPAVLWPAIDFWRLVWGVLHFQTVQPYLDKKKKHVECYFSI